MEHQFSVLLHPVERAAGWFAIQAPDNTLEPAIRAGDICSSIRKPHRKRVILSPWVTGPAACRSATRATRAGRCWVF